MVVGSCVVTVAADVEAARIVAGVDVSWADSVVEPVDDGNTSLDSGDAFGREDAPGAIAEPSCATNRPLADLPTVSASCSRSPARLNPSTVMELTDDAASGDCVELLSDAVEAAVSDKSPTADLPDLADCVAVEAATALSPCGTSLFGCSSSDDSLGAMGFSGGFVWRVVITDVSTAAAVDFLLSAACSSGFAACGVAVTESVLA